MPHDTRHCCMDGMEQVDVEGCLAIRASSFSALKDVSLISCIPVCFLGDYKILNHGSSKYKTRFVDVLRMCNSMIPSAWFCGSLTTCLGYTMDIDRASTLLSHIPYMCPPPIVWKALFR